MNGVLSVMILWWGLESPPQVLNLNIGVAMSETRSLVLLIPTHHSCAMRVILKQLTIQQIIFSYNYKGFGYINHK